ncbi:hypothetical protein C8R43DRAFT_1118545 [Mycena crocata]|nr:hypothetical protein C8R43DRAFT_1118545 [Mycena crocata]
MAHQAATGILDEAVEAEKSHDRSPTFPLSIPSEAISAFSSSCTADPDPSSSPSSHRKPSKKALSARRDNTHLISRSDRQLHHGRVQQASVSLGISHGGGRLHPEDLYSTTANTQVTSKLKRNEFSTRLTGWANPLFGLSAMLFVYYPATLPSGTTLYAPAAPPRLARLLAPVGPSVKGGAPSKKQLFTYVIIRSLRLFPPFLITPGGSPLAGLAARASTHLCLLVCATSPYPYLLPTPPHLHPASAKKLPAPAPRQLATSALGSRPSIHAHYQVHGVCTQNFRALLLFAGSWDDNPYPVPVPYTFYHNTPGFSPAGALRLAGPSCTPSTPISALGDPPAPLRVPPRLPSAAPLVLGCVICAPHHPLPLATALRLPYLDQPFAPPPRAL